MMWKQNWLPLCALIGLGSITAAGALADPAPFDLAGPTIEVTVTRNDKTLPISQVPNLASGDRLSIKADLPATQSAHYILVAAFLRGATNPPPPSWFFPCETWSPRCAQNGLTLTVPADAQQLLLFLAPETGGDFKTLVNAVRGRPGAFVRASQDLNQATLDRARLEVYLSAVRALDQGDRAALRDAVPLLARSLAIKVDDKCLDRAVDVQAPCLTQGQNSLILNDGHSTSIVQALTSGPASDLMMEASYTPQLNYGYYSPYIASVLDIARILDSFHTAQYQYIPALTTQQGARLALSLNTPPSFNNPKSVLVVALPAIEQPQLPPLHAVDPKQAYCARRTPLVLPLYGAPLAFATGYAHDMTLSLSTADGGIIDVAAHADARLGGFVVDSAGLMSAGAAEATRGSLHGYWGFDRYQGPSFPLLSSTARKWQLASADQATLIVGREDTIELQAGNIDCLAGVTLKDASGRELPAEYSAVGADTVQVKLAMQQARPGALTLLVAQYGAPQPQAIALHAYADAARLDSFTLHAGDVQGVLRGTRLDEVAGLSLKGMEFSPGKLSSSQGIDQLPMLASDSAASALFKPGDSASARVALKDGRQLELTAVVGAPRPQVLLIGKSAQLADGAGVGGGGSSGGSGNIQLASQDELPQDAKLTFSLHAQTPPMFTTDEKIEVATANQSASTTLGFDNGGITLVDAQVAVATLDPARAFGPSGFGPLQFRIVNRESAGDWQPLATLVRLPVLSELQCPATRELACKLSGSNLFLVDSVASNALFDHAVQVPDGFPGYALPVPHPVDGQLYVRLRDDPSVVNAITLQAQQLPPTADELARAATRHLAATSNADAGTAAPASSDAGGGPSGGITSGGVTSGGGGASGNTSRPPTATSTATATSADNPPAGTHTGAARQSLSGDGALTGLAAAPSPH
jgi:uncharacterized membrane protein YgcG